MRNVVKLRLLEAKQVLYNLDGSTKKLLNYKEHSPSALKDVLELCAIKHNFKDCTFRTLFAIYSGLPSENLKRSIRGIIR
jgi:hypothetical protein